MPRAALRKPDPGLDLSASLLMPEDMPAEVRAATLFGIDQPLEIEVGSGKGLFLRNAAQNRPEHCFLGIEIAKKYAVHVAARIAKAGLTNARVLAGDAAPLFDPREEKMQLADGSVEAIHVYFPDPWWKKRHRKRRVLSDANVVQFCRVLRVGGRLHFWTDVLDYFEITIERIAQITPQLGVPIPEVEAASTHDLDFHTHFERRSRQMAIPVYRVCYTKRSA